MTRFLAILFLVFCITMMVFPVKATDFTVPPTFDLSTSSNIASATNAVYRFHGENPDPAVGVQDFSVKIPAGYSARASTTVPNIIVMTISYGTIGNSPSGSGQVVTTTTANTYDVYVNVPGPFKIGSAVLTPPTPSTDGMLTFTFTIPVFLTVGQFVDLVAVAGLIINPPNPGVYTWGVSATPGGTAPNTPVNLNPRPSFTNEVTIVTARLTINSALRSNAPTIDGILTPGEWTNLQLHLVPADGYPIEAFIYFENDHSNLYVMVDAVGDTTDGHGDECLLVFHSNAIYALDIFGVGGSQFSNGLTATIGFHDSPNSATNHKIYEWAIPLSSIHTSAGSSVDFSSPKKEGTASMTFDSSNQNDNVWPSWLNPDPDIWSKDFETWGILNLAGVNRPVGGVVVPTNKLEIVAPFAALAGLVVAVSAVAVVKRRRA
jgi:hypothetical protein